MVATTARFRPGMMEGLSPGHSYAVTGSKIKAASPGLVHFVEVTNPLPDGAEGVGRKYDRLFEASATNRRTSRLTLTDFCRHFTTLTHLDNS